MRHLTHDECVEWCATHRVDLSDRTQNSETFQSTKIDAPLRAESLLAVSRRLEEGIGPWHSCLLWVTADDIWQSSANLHLYYRLRHSYGDDRQMSQAPGHLFLNYEDHDLVTFIHIPQRIRRSTLRHLQRPISR